MNACFIKMQAPVPFLPKSIYTFFEKAVWQGSDKYWQPILT
jgi:hypothetical protein